MASAVFSKFAGILSAALSQHCRLGFEIAQLEFQVEVEQGEIKEATKLKALFVVMLHKAHLTSHSRMSGSSW